MATLFASGTASYRAALIWATVTTFAGALAATLVGARLAAAFSGGGLLPANLVAQPAILAAVAAGAALTVGVATRVGMPVSTTHAILGALIGAGGMAAAGQIHFAVLAKRFVAPLLLSPLAAFALVAAIYPVLSGLRRRLGIHAASCLCLSPADSLTVARSGEAVAFRTATPVVHRCDRRYDGSVIGVDAARLVSGAHFLSAGLQSFARGLNDTPKIAAMALGASAAGAATAAGGVFVGVGVAMLAGGWFGARRVGETMSHRITTLNEGQALTSSSITATLVLGASIFALPVSMTHVAVGSLAGLGWSSGQARWSVLRQIAGSWLLTLPLAAALGAVTFIIMERVFG